MNTIVKEIVELSHGSGGGEHRCSVGKSIFVTDGCKHYLPHMSVDRCKPVTYKF
jgi:hypothetical protein